MRPNIRLPECNELYRPGPQGAPPPSPGPEPQGVPDNRDFQTMGAAAWRHDTRTLVQTGLEPGGSSAEPDDGGSCNDQNKLSRGVAKEFPGPSAGAGPASAHSSNNMGADAKGPSQGLSQLAGYNAPGCSPVGEITKPVKQPASAHLPKKRHCIVCHKGKPDYGSFCPKCREHPNRRYR
jgi:hypothetical protein